MQTRTETPLVGQPPDRAFWPLRWWELLPELVLGAGLTFFLIDQTDAATSAFKSGQALAIMVAATLVWAGARVAAARFVPWPGARVVPFAVGTAIALAVVVLPSYRNETVVETFPGGLAASPATTAAAPAAGGPATTTAPGPSPAPTAPPTTVPPATGPVLLRTSSFAGIDHRASGTVNVYRAPGGGFVVGLEGIDIQPGPDYDLYVVPGADRQDRSGGTRLDDLRGNRGTQFYEVPAGLDLSTGPWTVLVWCQIFAVPVANATPA